MYDPINDKLHITEELIDSVSDVIFESIHNKKPDNNESEKYALAAYQVIECIDNALPNWPHTKTYLHDINEEMAGCVLDDIHRCLDQLNVPRGTFSDEHFYNFVAMYNNQRNMLTAMQAQKSAKTDNERIIELERQVETMTNVFTELANWPEKETSYLEMKTVAASLADPNKVPTLTQLFGDTNDK